MSQGDVLNVGPGRSALKVVGFVDDTSYSGAGALWAAPATWRKVQNANRPASAVGPGVFQALVVETDGSSAAVAGRIERATGGDVEAVSVADAANAIGGVEQQRSVFNQIIGVTVVIAAIVVALFFALLTVERIAMYGMLKAIGARSRTLFGGVVTQAALVALIAAVIGGGVAFLLDVVLPPGALPYELLVSRVVISTAALEVAAIAGSAFSLHGRVRGVHRDAGRRGRRRLRPGHGEQRLRARPRRRARCAGGNSSAPQPRAERARRRRRPRLRRDRRRARSRSPRRPGG